MYLTLESKLHRLYRLCRTQCLIDCFFASGFEIGRADCLDTKTKDKLMRPGFGMDMFSLRLLLLGLLMRAGKSWAQ